MLLEPPNPIDTVLLFFRSFNENTINEVEVVMEGWLTRFLVLHFYELLLSNNRDYECKHPFEEPSKIVEMGGEKKISRSICD